MDEDISIDIHVTKLLEWLISRRHCTIHWQSQVAAIREKINLALDDMPEHPAVVEQLSGCYVNYFTCCEIIQILKTTEEDSKNLFGIYGSKRMKDWQEIIKLYQKDNVYLAEVANFLLRNVKYEIPGLKKQIAKFKQLQQECDKKIADYAKNAISAQKELETMKKQLGISGDKIKAELLRRTLKLDESFDVIVSHVKNLRNAVNYYSKFTKVVADAEYSLPLISHILEKGNTTTFEWLYGVPPTRIETSDINKLINDAEKVDQVEEIDWDIDVEDKGSEDFGITSIDESGIEIETSEKDCTVAHGQEAFLILDNPRTRNELLAHLFELQSFLKMRLLEIQKDCDSLIMIEDRIQEPLQNIVSMLDNVQVVIQLMLDPTNQQLHYIKHSTRYIDKMTSFFDQKLASIEKFIATREAVKNRKEELIKSENEMRPKLATLINKTKWLQEKVENELSRKYKNRPVHLMGGL